MHSKAKESLTLVKNAEEISARNEEKIKGQRRILTFDEILSEECSPIEFVMNPWLIKQGIALVYAERGIGKTHFAFNSAFAIATGGMFLKWDAPLARKVLYLDGEMQFALVKNRAVMMQQMYKSKSTPNFYMLTPDKYNQVVPDLSTEEGQRIINSHLLELQCEVLVIDNIATLMPGLKGNDNDQWGRIIQPWLLELRRKGIATLVVHHAGKPNKDQPMSGRGGSGKEDVADTVIRLSRPQGYLQEQGARFNVEFTKSRHFYGDDAMLFEAWLKEDNNILCWNVDNAQQTTYEQVCHLANQGKMQKEIVEIVKVSKGRVSILVSRGIEEGLITL